jgi:hypothetical protein
MTQKSTVLVYFAAEALNIAKEIQVLCHAINVISGVL